MKDSSLLKWAHNNNKNNKGKNKEEKNKNWIHPAESLTTGHIAYLVKFLGSTEVDKPKGIEVVKDGIRKLKFSQQIKKAEGTKTPKVELTVSVDGVAIQEPKTKKIQHQYPLHRISYCADDKAEKRFFSFIAKEEDEEKHTCFVFVSDKLAEEITLTIGQAFDLAYKRYMSGNNKDGNKTPEEENLILKQRLKELSSLLTSTQLSEFLEKHNICDICEIKEETNDNRSEISNGNNKSNSNDISQASSEQSTDDQLINLDSPVTKFDNMTLDDLNDDDFDPRAGDSDSSDDFNPRSFPTPVIKQSPQAATTPNQSFGTPQGFGMNNFTVSPLQQQQQQIVLTPPALPPRDPGKFPAKSVPTNNPTNPFASPIGFGSVQDPFGMSTFTTPPSDKNGVTSNVASTDVFADLDPLKK